MFESTGKQCQRYFTAFCVLHALLWVIMPLCCRYMLPFDTVEGIAWGLQWQWGYDKHPPLAPWLTALAAMWQSHMSLSVYIMAQLIQVMGFWALWRLGQYFFQPQYALIAVTLLSGVWFYNILTPKFNPNTMMMPMWSLALLCFYRATTIDKYRDWILTGVLLALCMLTKYQSGLFVFCVYLYALLVRRELKTPYRSILLMSLASLVVMLPNLYDVYQQNFLPLIYAAGQVDVSAQNGLEHGFKYILNPMFFLLEQVGALLPLLLLMVPLGFRNKEKLNWSWQQTWFVAIFALGPLLISSVLTAFTSNPISARWGAPYLFLSGFVAVMLVKPKVTQATLKKYATAVLGMMLTLVIARGAYFLYGSSVFSHARPDAHFPAQKFSDRVVDEWQKRENAPLRYVVGSRYLIAVVTAYSKERPIPVFEASLVNSSWLDVEDAKRHGAMFASWHGEHDEMLKRAKELFGKVKTIGVVRIERHQKNPEKKYVTIYLAYIPPADRT